MSQWFVALLLVSGLQAQQAPAGKADAGKVFWQGQMCNFCHGTNGEGGWGPDLAGRALGTPGCAESARKLEAGFVRREGDALRLLGDVPEPWLLDALEVTGFKTDFGALTFRHVGFYNNRTLDLEPGCAPPGGFLMPVGPKHKAKIDGKDAEAKDGLLRFPSGTKRVELTRPY